MVEAFTIVLAMGLTRGWRSALAGTISALVALAGVATLAGYALVTWFPKSLLQLVVGTLLLVFGLQWLRKAILRASGWRAIRDEDAVFAREADAARQAAREERAGLDWYAFTISFKGVRVEGLEVAFIVLTFGSAQGSIPLAAAGAAAAALLVVLAGFVVREPLSRVPENTLAFAVGVMLTTFGIFWGAEGAGVDWPGGDAALPVVLAFVTLISFGFVTALRRRRLVPA